MMKSENSTLSHSSKRSIWVVPLCVGILAVVVYLIPSPIDPKPYHFEKSPPKLEGPLSINPSLQRAKKIFEGQVIGPESFAVDNQGRLYTGCADGKIWSFYKDQLRLVTVTGKNYTDCGSFDLEPVCGRPKGMKVVRGDNLIVVDAYLGLLKVSLTSGNIETLISSSQGLGGTPFKFLNGLDISSTNVVYFTDSSTKWDRRHHKYEVIETNNYGRLLEYDLNTGKGRVLLSGLYLANGVALSPDESFLLVAEMSVCRIRKFYLKGPKAGRSEILMDNLPGYPDNIKVNSKGHFYVGMATVRFEGASLTKPFLDVIAPYPAVKRFIAKVTPFWLYNVFIPKHSMLVEIDGHGAIINSYHDPSAQIFTGVSEGFQYKDRIYIGHFAANFIGEILVSDL